MDLEDRLYSSTEVADILGVSLRSVYRYLEDGDLKAEVKTATGRHRFTRQDILNFLYPDSAKASTQNVPILKTTSRPVRAKNTPRAVPTTSKEPTKEELAEETDWLERFRAARKAMAQGEEVAVAGFGTFKVAKRAARMGVNPRTGEKIQIAASIKPKFRAGKVLKEAVQ